MRLVRLLYVVYNLDIILFLFIWIQKKCYQYIIQQKLIKWILEIGLADLLTYFGIKHDYTIGHSVGELGCAYADGCFTAEQMVLSALSRGMAWVESNLPKGSMTAVGLGYEDLEPLYHLK